MPAKINPTSRILMGPGPCDAHPDVLKIMSTPLMGHLDPQFIRIMDEVKEMERKVFQTSNELTLVIPGTGTSGMEACLVNLLEPGDAILVCVSGYFGNRLCQIAERCGAKLIRIDAPWGEPIDPAQVKEALEKSNPKLVAIVQAETSTGVLQPLEQISKMVHDKGALFLVDAVTSLGGTSLKLDEWNIDAVYSCTQKCISAPPGLSPVSFSENAVRKMADRKTKPQSWYLDLSLLRSYWEGEKRAYHHTAPISMIYAVHEALRLVLEEGLHNRFDRHLRNHQVLRDGLEALGLQFHVAPQFRLPMLNTIKIPAGFEDATVRGKLLNDYNLEIGGGLGDLAGKVWRVGLMGQSSNQGHIDTLLHAMKNILG